MLRFFTFDSASCLKKTDSRARSAIGHSHSFGTRDGVADGSRQYFSVEAGVVALAVDEESRRSVDPAAHK